MDASLLGIASEMAKAGLPEPFSTQREYDRAAARERLAWLISEHKGQ